MSPAVGSGPSCPPQSLRVLLCQEPCTAPGWAESSGPTPTPRPVVGWAYLSFVLTFCKRTGNGGPRNREGSLTWPGPNATQVVIWSPSRAALWGRGTGGRCHPYIGVPACTSLVCGAPRMPRHTRRLARLGPGRPAPCPGQPLGAPSERLRTSQKRPGNSRQARNIPGAWSASCPRKPSQPSGRSPAQPEA